MGIVGMPNVGKNNIIIYLNTYIIIFFILINDLAT
jgi:hypothetical protein